MKKLVCFPYAGGGASIFYNWHTMLDVDEVIPIVLPGREDKISERPLTSIDEIVHYTNSQLKELVNEDDTLILFGHCFGGLVAFEVAKSFEKEYKIKELIISSSFAPSCVKKESFSKMDDDDLISFLELKTGMHSEAFEYEELRELVLVPIRSDLLAFENYFENQEMISTPIIAIHAVNDNYIQESDVKLWKKHTSSDFTYKENLGNHMYILNNPQELFDEIEDCLKE